MAARASATPVIDVAVMILRAAEGRVLMAERLPRQLSPGYWELPGGKLDPGESIEQAARREALEEIGVEVTQARPYLRYEHPFPLRRLRLHFFLAEAWRGTPHGREGQRIAWVDPAAPGVAPVLPSNLRVLAVLGLPGALLECAGLEPFTPSLLVQAARAHGRIPILLRAERASPGQRVQRLAALRPIRERLGLSLWLSGSLHDLPRVGAQAWHSPATTLPGTRPDVPLWVVECGDLHAAERALQLGADVLMLNHPRIGQAELARLAANSPAVYVRASESEPASPGLQPRPVATGPTEGTAYWVRIGSAH